MCARKAMISNFGQFSWINLKKYWKVKFEKCSTIWLIYLLNIGDKKSAVGRDKSQFKEKRSKKHHVKRKIFLFRQSISNENQITLLLFINSAESFFAQFSLRIVGKCCHTPYQISTHFNSLFNIRDKFASHFSSKILQFLRFFLETYNHEHSSIYYLMIAQYCSDLVSVENSHFSHYENGIQLVSKSFIDFYCVSAVREMTLKSSGKIW